MDTLGDCFPEEIENILKEAIENISFFPPPIQQKILRFKAYCLLNKPDEELSMILHLVESHTPGLRLKADMEYDWSTYKEDFIQSTTKRICREKFDINILLDRIAELPKEWTVIQITPQFCSKDIFAISSDQLLTNGVHITVFDCGKKNNRPYCVTLSGANVAIRVDMKRLKANLREILSIPDKKGISMKSKKEYYTKRLEMEESLKSLLTEIEGTLLGAWKCLFIGKYEDNSINTKIHKLVEKFLREMSLEEVTDKVKNILVQLVKLNISSKPNESVMNNTDRTILKYCFPSGNYSESWKLFWKKQRLEELNLKRHPVLLIVDEALDAFPWEMISTLIGEPASRMSSLHLLYSIFKTHENTIVDGYKIITDYSNGRFILNPGSDLNLMEKRLKAFFDYWLPQWNGLVGKEPNSEEFLEALTDAAIFSYSGHGSGRQYCSSGKIQKAKIDSVVLLFGCGSNELVDEGPSVEMYGSSQMYSLAGCPCLIGMLWVVTDIDTDVLTTSFLSTWIPNSQAKPWQLVNEKEWIDQGIVTLDKEESNEKLLQKSNEPNLLEALLIAKNKMKYFCNRAAVIARGIPVKLKIS